MLFEWVLEQFHCMLEVLEHPRGHGFRWVSRRWVVERTLAWISRCRRLSQDDEKNSTGFGDLHLPCYDSAHAQTTCLTFATSKTPSQINQSGIAGYSGH